MKEKKAWTYETMKLYEKNFAYCGLILGLVCFILLLLVNVSSSLSGIAPYLYLGTVFGIILYHVGTKPWQRW